MTITNIITSTANDKVKRIRSLAQKKNRDAEKVFVVEGAEHLQKAIANGWEVETLIYTELNAELLRLARAQKAAVFEVNEKVASYATNRDNPQNVIGVLKQKFTSIETLSQKGIWLGLENVRDPGNLGTIIRTADAVGVAGILLIGDCCDAFSPEVVRATTGSFSAVPLVQISTENFVAWRKNFSGKIVGTHLNKKAIDYREVKLAQLTLLLMGGEQAGLTLEVSSVCDEFAKIPMRAGVESLNLAVSTAIMLYQVANLR